MIVPQVKKMQTRMRAGTVSRIPSVPTAPALEQPTNRTRLFIHESRSGQDQFTSLYTRSNMVLVGSVIDH